MRLDKVDMVRIFDHQPEYIRFFYIDKDKCTKEEWANFIALPMLVRKAFIRGNKESIDAIKLQFPYPLLESGNMYLGTRTKYSVELDITTRCNLSCPNCVRFSNFKSTWADMGLPYILDFIEANEHYGKNLTVKVIGGEPLVHKEVDTILTLLHQHFNVMLATNGIIDWVPPFDMVVENSDKIKGNPQLFYATSDAPIDDPRYAGEDFSFGCSIPYTCGAVYTVDGYYPCTTAGSIDRMLRLPGGPRYGMDSLAQTTLVKAINAKQGVFSQLCQYCGVYKKLGFMEAENTTDSRVTEQVLSPSWSFMEGR